MALFISRADEFRCSSTQTCIEASLICNQFSDCPADEDESEMCKPQLCPKNTFRCSYGRCVDNHALCDNFNDCINGDDESDLLCKSRSCSGPDCGHPNCPSIVSSRLQFSCTFKNETASCSEDIKPGTVAKYSCREFYQPANAFHKFNDEAVCQPNGKWSTEILRCEPKCGYLKAPTPLIVNGYRADTAFPWHATVFVRKDNDFIFACGATLITESVVLSAAHCFVDADESRVKIAMGKLHANITTLPDEPLAVVFGVARIVRHPLYLDKLGNYGSDIALVELNQSVILSDDLHPACVDWELSDITANLANKAIGTIVGLGISENDTNSDSLRMAQLPVVANEECVKLQPRDFQKYVTFTTFCAGWGNGTSVCNGDSGGGLMFLSRNRESWKVQGVVSLSPRRQSTFFCDPFKYTVFTKVGLYAKWIRFVLDGIHAAHAPSRVEYEPILRTPSALRPDI